MPILVTAGFSEAQSGPPGKPVDDGWSVYVGAAAIYTPTYLGDDDHNLSVVPSIRITKGENFTASVEDGIRYKALSEDGLSIGPMAKIDFGRDEDGGGPFRIAGDKTNDLIGFGDIDTTVSLGAFAEYEFEEFALKVSGGQAVSGHDGFTGEISLQYKPVIRIKGPPLIIGVGPRVKFADRNYTQSYFGITPAQALATGLPAYEAGGGITSYGLGGNLLLPLTRDGLGMVVFGGYERLSGDAADSPLVLERGSRDQYSIGAALSQKF
ncbi:MAG: MipA/OmpV family protein [Hellea sp.]|nr:MipA/OmpV family protein [Hellea sp.]